MPAQSTSPPILLITHLPDPSFGLWEDVLARQGVRLEHRNLQTGALPTDPSGFSAIVSLGGQMSATDPDAFLFLTDELELLGRALELQTPVFGLCLGAQLLALAGGGGVATMPERYIGWPELRLTPAAADDPVFGGCRTGVPVLKWHSDGIDAPPPATIIATTASPGCAIFRVGPCAWGSQMHLEADPAMLFDRWLPDPVEVEAMRGAGLDVVQFTAECRRRLPPQVAAMRPALERFTQYLLRGQATAGRPLADRTIAG